MYFDYAQYYKQKGFTPIIILIGILIVALIGSGAYYLGNKKAPLPSPSPVSVQPSSTSSSSDETLNWKTYKNDKYGIEFQYPDSWMLDDHEALSINLPDQSKNFVQINITNEASTRDDELNSCQPGKASAVYQVGKLRDSQQTFEKFVDFDIENPERGIPPAVKPKLISTEVGGRKALKIERTIDNCMTEFYYVDQNLDKYLTISFIADKNNDKLLHNQILSTFRFD